MRHRQQLMMKLVQLKSEKRRSYEQNDIRLLWMDVALLMKKRRLYRIIVKVIERATYVD